MDFDGILGSFYFNCIKIEGKGFIYSIVGYWRGLEIVLGIEGLGVIIFWKGMGRVWGREGEVMVEVRVVG